jgi:starch synthase (maltosyl-transferring)
MQRPWVAPSSAIADSTNALALDSSPADPTGPRFHIEDIYPSVDGGRYPAKRIAGEPVDIWADILREGHDVVAASVLWRREDCPNAQSVPMRLVDNDRWHAQFTPREAGFYLLTIEAWTDRFATWRKDILLKRKAGHPVALEIEEGIALVRELAGPPHCANQVALRAIQDARQSGDPAALLDDAVAGALIAPAKRQDLTRSVISLLVDPPIARTGAWYEMVPRSQGTLRGRHGTFDDCIARLPDITALGFDVVYLPPIHPIGTTNRKGRNNTIAAAPGDPGSLYAIGSAHGGHDAVHPELGTLDDFRRFVDACNRHGLKVALDFAIQCSPDHPWLKQHSEWFNWRGDGSIRYAENPPKKYEDIVNPDFYCADRIALWEALRDVVLFWVRHGVRIFRVDNPHTKPFPFWEWMIREVRSQEPNVVFLSEAFTRPKIMKVLAKIGFSQSYSYFTWRTTKSELQEYLSELVSYPTREYFRPNFFVTTPDILPVQLQSGEAWLFKARFALAATLSSSYGIYNGYELLEHEPLPGREEYLNSDKYEIRIRDWDKPGNIKPYIAELNRLRHENAALSQTNNLVFAQINDPNVIGFVKESVGNDNAVAVAIALSPGSHEFWFHFGDIQIGRDEARAHVRTIENLVTGERHILEWGGVRLRIDTLNDPALLFRCYA